MHPAVEIRTADPDRGSSIALWCSDLINEFVRVTPNARVVIDDAGPGEATPLHAMRDGSTVRLRCASASVTLPPRPLVALARKAMVRAGLTHDWAPIDHHQVIRLQQRVVSRARAVLGAPARERPCEFLLRVDDFPATPDGLSAFRQFHQIAHEHRVPYLLAVTPFLSTPGAPAELSPGAVALLHTCVAEGAELAVHGFTHVSRSAEFRNELLGMPATELRVQLDRAAAHFAGHGLDTIGFVAPFNGYDAGTFGVLAERFSLIGGGPESVTSLGYRAGPSFLHGALYVPSYRGAYDIPLERPGAIESLARLAADAHSLTIPVTLHWSNTAPDGFAGFRALCAHLSRRTARWSEVAGRASLYSSSTCR